MMRRQMLVTSAENFAKYVLFVKNQQKYVESILVQQIATVSVITAIVSYLDNKVVYLAAYFVTNLFKLSLQNCFKY
jgi:hypothetical protein